MNAIRTNKNCLTTTLTLLIASLSFVLSGCTYQLTFDPVQYPLQHKHDINTQLVQTDALCNAQYHHPDGETIQFGGSICKNTEGVAAAVFRSVSIDRISDEKNHAHVAKTDTILIPRVKTIDRNEPMWASSEQTTTIVMEWILKDAKDGKEIWLATFTGNGKGPKAPGMSREEGARRQIAAALDDLFGKTFRAMSSSVEIREFARQKANEK